MRRRVDCPFTYTLGLCHSWSQISSFQTICCKTLNGAPGGARSCMFVSPGIWGRADPWSFLCSHWSNSKLLWCLTQLQTQSRSLSLVSASHCLWVPPGKQFFLESVLISVLLCWLSHPKPCQPYQPQEPWWPWGTCWPFQASRNSFSSCVIPKASRSACWYSHTRSLAAEGNLK